MKKLRPRTLDAVAGERFALQMLIFNSVGLQIRPNGFEPNWVKVLLQW